MSPRVSKWFSSIIAFIFIVGLYILPVFTHAVIDPESQNGGTGIVYQCKDGDCNFADFIMAIKWYLGFGVKFALMFTVVVIAWAGFKYMMSGDNPGERKAANKMLLSVVKGIAVIMGAWLIVTFIASSLLSEEYKDLNLLKN